MRPALQPQPEAVVQGAHPFFTYTTQVLSWRLGQPAVPRPEVPAPGADDAARCARRLERILRAAATHPHSILLGLGTGELAAALARALPAGAGLTVISADPAAAQALLATGRLDWLTPDGPAQLLVDSSRQALVCLPLLTGLAPERALVTVNPEPRPPEEDAALAWVRRMFRETVPLPPCGAPATPGPTPPPVTLAVLARPQEPGLADFFAACAGLARQAVILWDGRDVPETARTAAALDMPVRHLARPLENDFAAQRNALLDACPDGWLLSLDPDERPTPDLPRVLARLTARPDLGAAYFPRLTLYPDAGHAKIGHGLWPDLQLRLWRNTSPRRARYVRPVHERLEGLAGRAALALDTPLFHCNRLLADDRAVSAKLAAYNVAAGMVRHHLSPEYPVLPLRFFTGSAGPTPQPRLLLLPALW